MISIHALREESDLTTLTYCSLFLVFQSTLSVRRATSPCADHALRGVISIHALREESDVIVHSTMR